MTISVSGDTHRFNYKCIRIWLAPDNLKTPMYQSVYEDFSVEVLKNKSIQRLLSILVAKKRLYQPELSALLFIFAPVFLSILEKVASSAGFMQHTLTITETPGDESYRKLEETLHLVEDDKFRVICEATAGMTEQMNIIMKYNDSCGVPDHLCAKSNFADFLNCFHRDYLKGLVEQIYPEYYVASFSKNKDNISLWGHYAKGHSGICLVFRPRIDGEKSYIEMENGEKSFEKSFLTPMIYDDTPSQLNWFENIAHLPWFKLVKYWLSEGEALSGLCDKYSNGQSWRESFWDRYEKKIHYKFNDWKFEDEIRTTKDKSWFDTIPAENRIFRYKFDQLEGIIFGLRTDEGIQINIMKVIEEKMKLYGNRDFGFYRTEYSSFQHKLGIKRLSLLRFELKTT